MTSVRTATVDDVTDLVALGRMMHRESPRFSRFAFVAGKVEALIRSMIASPHMVVFVAEESGFGVIGMFGGIVGEHFFTTDRFATDVAVFVVPQFRGTSAFPRLLQAFESWATEQGVLEIAPGISTEVSPERTLALYEQKGFRLSGSMVVKYV